MKTKYKIFFAMLLVIGLISLSLAVTPPKEFGFDKIMNFSDGYAYFGKVVIGDASTPLDLDATLGIVGDVNFTGDLEVGGNTTFRNDIIISGNLRGTSPLEIIDSINITGNLNMTGNASILGSLNVTDIQLTRNCANGQILKWSGGVGTCGTDNSGGGGGGTQIILFSSGANDLTADGLFFGIAKGDSSEAEVQILFPFDITVTGIHCNQGLAGGSDRASFTLRDDGVDTAITCTTSAGVPTCLQTGQSVNIDGGSLIAIAYEEVATATAGYASCIVTHTGD